MNCNICSENIVIPTVSTICTKNIAVEKNGQYICNACYEASLLFCEDSPRQEVKSKPKKKEVSVKMKYICLKCKTSYEGKACSNCNTPNPMFMRKKSKKGKKKKK